MALPPTAARELVDHHRRTFRGYWAWSDAVEAHAVLRRELVSVFGWRIAIGGGANSRFLRNFPMQANGAEMLRLACCSLTEGGLRVCATLHDAVLIEARLADLDDAVATARRLMAEASAIALDGLRLRTSVKQIRFPDRWADPRGHSVWSAVTDAFRKPPEHRRDATCSPAHSRSIYLYDAYKGGVSDASD